MRRSPIPRCRNPVRFKNGLRVVERAIGAYLIGSAVLLPVCLLQIHWTRLEFGLLLDHLMNDDTFLYLQVVRNIASQGHVTFDGLHTTTDTQPLWTVVLVPLASAFDDRELRDPRSSWNSRRAAHRARHGTASTMMEVGRHAERQPGGHTSRGGTEPGGSTWRDPATAFAASAASLDELREEDRRTGAAASRAETSMVAGSARPFDARRERAAAARAVACCRTPRSSGTARPARRPH